MGSELINYLAWMSFRLGFNGDLALALYASEPATADAQRAPNHKQETLRNNVKINDMVSGERAEINRCQIFYQCLRVCALESKTGVSPSLLQCPSRKREEMLQR